MPCSFQGGRFGHCQAQPQRPPGAARARTARAVPAASAAASARQVVAEDHGGLSTAAGHHGGNVAGRGEKDHDSREGTGSWTLEIWSSKLTGAKRREWANGMIIDGYSGCFPHTEHQRVKHENQIWRLDASCRIAIKCPDIRMVV